MPLPLDIGTGIGLLTIPPWTPAQLPGFLAWYDGVQAFNGAVIGTPVASWAARAGTAGALAQATGAKQPLVSPAGDGLIFDGADDFMAIAFTNSAPFTTFLVGRGIVNTLSRYYMDGVTQNTMVAFESPNAVDIRLYSGGVGPTKSGAGLSPWALAGIYNAASNLFTLYYNTDSAVTANQSGVAASAGLTLGSRNDGANNGNVHIQAAIVCSGVLAAPLIRQTLDYLIARYPQKTNNLVMVYEGDSRSLDSTTYPTKVTSWLVPTVTGNNVATTGETMAQIVTQTAATIAFFNGAKTNIAVLHAGLNDSRLNGTSAAAIEANINSWCTTVRAAGFKVVVCTEIDCQDALANLNNWHSTIWPALNALIRANWTGYADRLCDLGNDVRFQNALDTTYYNVDAIHQSALGYAVNAALVTRTIQSLL